MELAELVKRLKAHDWAWEYSDSIPVQNKGLEEEKILIRELKQLNPKEVNFIINLYVPLKYRNLFRIYVDINFINYI